MSEALNPQAAGPHSLLQQATQLKDSIQAHIDTLRPAPVEGDPLLQGGLGQTVSQAETDLLTLVRQKLNRVATDFGIPYSEIRDFFVSKL